jgi:hypothetical protein
MKDALETVKILSAYDLTKSLRGAAVLTGCSHHTVSVWWLFTVRGELTGSRS